MSQALESFLSEIGEIVGRTSDPRATVELVSEAVRRVLAGPPFMDPRGLEATREGGFARRELHRDPAGRFVVVACHWLSAQSTRIHDHPSWGIVAGVVGRITATTYRRADDGATPGYASLSEVTRTLVSETSFALVRPPDESIHRLENPFRDGACTLHVYGLGEPPQNVYDPKAKTIAPADPSDLLQEI